MAVVAVDSEVAEASVVAVAVDSVAVSEEASAGDVEAAVTGPTAVEADHVAADFVEAVGVVAVANRTEMTVLEATTTNFCSKAATSITASTSFQQL